MKTNELQKLVDNYISTIDYNLNNIEDAINADEADINNLLPRYKEILTTTSSNVSERWLKREKYLRTEFVLSVLSDKYPKQRLTLSLAIDAMINILDDFYDEDLPKKQKQVFLIELLRTSSLAYSRMPNTDFVKELGIYLDKLITLAIAEDYFLNLIKKTNNLEKVVKYSKTLLLNRAMDIDYFAQIGLSSIEDSTMPFRIFRALNILKKDILDIERDLEAGQETVVTNICGRDFEKKKYFNKLSSDILSESKVENIELKKMIENEIVEIEKLASQL